MRRDVVFVHIPKTAGTSTRVILEKAAPDHLTLRDYGDAPETTPALYELVHRRRKVAEFRDHFSKKDAGILLSGHFPAARYWDAFNAESFVTFVRDPIDRVLSEYVHFVNRKGWTGSFEEFIARPGSRNVMSFFLAGVDLDRFGFIGFVEKFDASLGALSEFIGAKLPMRKIDAGDYGRIDPNILEDGKYRAMIADLNQADIALHGRLRETRWDDPRAAGADASIAAEYRGGVQLTARGAAVGWLSNRAREFIAEVEILRDGRPAATIKADRYRPGAKERGVSRSGVCGFRVNLRDLPGSDASGAAQTFSFRAAGGEYELNGSPIVFPAGGG